MNKKRKMAIEVAKSLLWVPYVWGGKNPMVALDCSGFIQAVLSYSTIGLMEPSPAKNSRSQLLRFPEVEDAYTACLAFYGRKDRINHVMMCIDTKWVIGSAGGNSTYTHIAKAMKYGACVKILPLYYRRDLVAITDPFLTMNGG